MASPQEKITVYNLADLKNTSDDAIRNYLTSLQFRQSHALTDVRLALGYAAFVVAAACFAWDYQLGFERTKHFTAAAVAVYMLLNGALTLWVWAVERGTTYVGTAPTGETVRVASSVKKNVPVYNLQIQIEVPPGDGAAKNPVMLDVSRPFTEWFDAAGHFVAPPFQSMLATAVPCVGKLDPKRVVAQSHAYTADMLDALAEASASVSKSMARSTAAEPAASVGKRGGKRRRA